MNGLAVDELLTEVLTTVDSPDLHAVAEVRQLTRNVAHVLLDAADMRCEGRGDQRNAAGSGVDRHAPDRRRCHGGLIGPTSAVDTVST